MSESYIEHYGGTRVGRWMRRDDIVPTGRKKVVDGRTVQVEVEMDVPNITERRGYDAYSGPYTHLKIGSPKREVVWVPAGLIRTVQVVETGDYGQIASRDLP